MSEELEYDFRDRMRVARPLVKAVMGVDPGVTGGATILSRDGAVIQTLGFRSGWTHRRFIAEFGSMMTALQGLNSGIPDAHLVSVALEKVGYIGRRADGSKDGGQGAFTFGTVNGLIRGAILSAGFFINEVAPQMWQGKLRCLSGGSKDVTKRKARDLWPSTPWTHATADSALIAEWLRRRNIEGIV